MASLTHVPLTACVFYMCALPLAVAVEMYVFTDYSRSQVSSSWWVESSAPEHKTAPLARIAAYRMSNVDLLVQFI